MTLPVTLKMDPDMQTPVESSSTPTPCNSKSVKKAVPTLDIQTAGSDMIGQEPRLNFQEWVNLTLDRECTPVLYIYFAGIAILAVITTGTIVIVGLQCNWNFVAVQ
ncbi:unnamed protein product [Litomosoides sigmodontis]|uniref:Uncharacterized protein n=1 Tax=Litomosoides sigmodontis TaxID=42156 RepID=A0A3P6T776_LITSI|nr:unnamed protein product [Litomosoides sigmodontis]